ncbi:hypothetical protein QGP82_16040 [Leptothoe sp. LEGE 181152]|nr:hypothetical protein [Leptothoe sp. LEGE 181152]
MKLHNNSGRNYTLQSNILRDCKRFENKEISVAELQQSLETYGSLLEDVERVIFQRLHNYSNELEIIQYARLLDEHYSETCKVIMKIRDCLETIE